jgi:hypothetical protein
LQKAQSRIKIYVDKLRIERSFEIGDWVYLCLQPYRKKSVALCRNLKLAPRFFGPYQIIQNIGSVAYKLDLPKNTSRISCFILKEKIGATGLTFPYSAAG